ncbi:DUF262 domain-containing protein [Halodesulfovibrio spirochaetisodalis]|uniref:DUF262 domain-containing protein n=1 Tax=Halodesulfovibrio spirochaetisodalis TaxID=1560234 RepID=A0A1B7XML7_9BACT|nr:DUF262 domain-containing protein [Halodesulfovibrio spirochaetisodalis]OBQ56752.1 hypothetical protein SP90_01310 [Halodesulfovibrio spirochaetisodalis]
MDISPDKQNIDRVFSSTTYHIDFYQRDYKWGSEPVIRLLDDIFYKFNEIYELKKDIAPGLETVTAYYPWYYLNTYVTNVVEGKVYIVDGQQRLTTLTLILIKLKQLADMHDSKLAGWIENKIVGKSGYGSQFWMNHEGHTETMEELLNNSKSLKEILPTSGITATNMVSNYQEISSFLTTALDEKIKFETFVFYFLHRLVLINLSVEQTEVPMVFEVINDRGVRLKPYEILKGKLLGQIDKLEIKTGSYNELWEEQVNVINKFRDDEIDSFFTYFLKAKYASTRTESQRFDKGYHREIFKADMDAVLELGHNPSKVKSFLNNEFKYYTTLYAKIWNLSEHPTPECPYVFYNRLNEMDAQYRLILSTCSINDREEDEKIEIVSRELDRLFTLLQLQGGYDSNKFTVTSYQIAEEIKEKPANTIRPIFEKHLIAMLQDKKQTGTTTAFNYGFFKGTSVSNLNRRFIRYFFARIEEFLANGTNMQMKQLFSDLVTKRGNKNGFHVEHILSRNPDNLKLFKDDEELFDVERNRLGGVLLLKGLDNISSNNETYANKLKTYANTLYWNETLREDTYKSKIDMRKLNQDENLDLKPLHTFGPAELEYRQETLFKIASKIWS